jgi:hypothetical protein
MMFFTHLLLSIAVAVVVAPLLGGSVGGPVLLGTLVVGGVAPDLDLLARHRRTLHYPVWYPVLTVMCLGVFWSTGATVALLASLLFGAAALHMFSDLLGGSAETAPWDPVTEFGVYNHVLGRWHRPRRLVQYSGAPRDFLLAGGTAAFVWIAPATPPGVRVVAVGLVASACGYTLARRRLKPLAEVFARAVPIRIRRLFPVLQVEESEGGGTTVSVRLNR